MFKTLIKQKIAFFFCFRELCVCKFYDANTLGLPNVDQGLRIRSLSWLTFKILLDQLGSALFPSVKGAAKRTRSCRFDVSLVATLL